VSALADDFTAMFRAEHRQVRDVLLGLIEAFGARDRSRVSTLLAETARLTGPHFRYEEEALYPVLSRIFGSPYIEHLFEEHDGAIGRARALVALAESDQLTDEDAARAVRLVREILPHVSDCDGLSVMVEVLPAEPVRSVFAARDRAFEAGLGLLEWADTIRGRPLVLTAR
jgi:hypothetical protein